MSGSDWAPVSAVLFVLRSCVSRPGCLPLLPSSNKAQTNLQKKKNTQTDATTSGHRLLWFRHFFLWFRHFSVVPGFLLVESSDEFSSIFLVSGSILELGGGEAIGCSRGGERAALERGGGRTARARQLR